MAKKAVLIAACVLGGCFNPQSAEDGSTTSDAADVGTGDVGTGDVGTGDLQPHDMSVADLQPHDMPAVKPKVLDPSGIAISTAANDQLGAGVAFNGTNFLVAWSDKRGGTTFDVYGSRVNKSGGVLDTSGIAIYTSTSDEKWATVGSDGTNYLVGWSDTFSLRGARLNPGGVVLDSSPPLALWPYTGNPQYALDLSFDGTNYLGVCMQKSGTGNTYDIYARRITSGGAVLDATGIAVTTVPGHQVSPKVAFDGTNHLVVWTDEAQSPNRNVYGARVTPSGTVLDTTAIPISTAANDQAGSSVAFGSTNYLVVWTDKRGGTSYDIYGARVSKSGAVLDASGFVISNASGDQQPTRVAFDGANYFVVWGDNRSGTNLDIYGARVSPNGAVLDTSGIAISTAASDQTYPQLAFDGTNYLVVWDDKRNGSTFDIYGARVSP